MTDPIRFDALASDDRLLDQLASRCYDGADPVGLMLLSFAQACDRPAPAARVRSGRRSARRVVISALVTATFVASGAGMAAAVSDNLSDGPPSRWASEIRQWMGLAGAGAVAEPATVTQTDITTSAGATTVIHPADQPVSGHVPVLRGEPVPVDPGSAPNGGAIGSPGVGAPSGPSSANTADPSNRPDSSSAGPVSPAELAPGKSGSAPGRTGPPGGEAAGPADPPSKKTGKGHAALSDAEVLNGSGFAADPRPSLPVAPPAADPTASPVGAG